MKRWQLCLGLVLGGSCFGIEDAAAQELGNSGVAAIGAERLMGMNFTTIDTDGADTSTTYLTFLGNPNFQSPYTTPRLTFDFFVTEGLSIGGGLTYASASGEIETNAGTTDLADTSFFAITPRAGFATMFNDSVGIWARGGITYYSADNDDSDFTVSGLAVNLDGMLVLTPAEHFAFTLGPVIDFPLSGSVEDNNNNEEDFDFTNIGLSVGLVGYF